MAAPTVTPLEVQAALSTDGHGARILSSFQITDGATAGAYYVVAGAEAPGRARWCAVTNTDDAATQVVSILAALRA